MSEDIVLSLNGATKLYGGVPAIDGVDFDLRRGEIHALVGENGAGKSTLMRVLSGMYATDAGTLEVNGRDVTGWSTACLRCSLFRQYLRTVLSGRRTVSISEA